MLKIRKDVNLEVLEKYGFIKETLEKGSLYLWKHENKNFVENLIVICDTRTVFLNVVPIKGEGIHFVESLDIIHDLMIDGIIIKEDEVNEN